MCAAQAQSSQLQTVAPMVGESMTVLMVKTLGLFAAQKGDLASHLPPYRGLLHPPVGQDRETHHNPWFLQLHLQPQPKSPPLLQEDMKSPSTATQYLPVAAAFRRRKMDTRSRSYEGIEAVPERPRRSALLCHKGTSFLHVWQTAHPTGRDRRQRGPVHKQWEEMQGGR